MCIGTPPVISIHDTTITPQEYPLPRTLRGSQEHNTLSPYKTGLPSTGVPSMPPSEPVISSPSTRGHTASSPEFNSGPRRQIGVGHKLDITSSVTYKDTDTKDSIKIQISGLAAAVLSASMTLLSLPGLDNVSRIPAFVAVLFSIFAMAFMLIVSGLHGFLKRRQRQGIIIQSMSLIILICAMISFIIGIVLYLFRGVTVTNPLAFGHPFDTYT